MSLLPLIFTAGWASGINAYAVVLLFGLFGVTGLSDDVPEGLQRTDVLIAAAVLFLIEAVADKVPYLDTFWDTLHTVVRPATGAVVAALIAGSDESLSQLAAAAVGGTTALVSHLVKAGLRMAINTSPEPASNIVTSAVEDLAVAGVVTLAIFYPVAAAIVAGMLLLIGLVLITLLASRIRRYRRRRRERRRAGRTPASSITPAD
ncbi:protein of unknown function [Nocardia amikacinitolerans]|uniref:DUF4126 domain-containing protein n=1 Tax=Nocardia amikacinitolerans TaxID=756689 RepID=A0A285LUN3_9NOCA|nr:DUF4126 domain-containing protein [Nocardia amikacinitolerans]MCP2280207.1 protein of unknown function (DUF4126) [Nocardia amikacinitolerans]MCP2299478.1 protein of unknown function (DUF4126) [Nocardia amikacinitolerans]SNY88644.1 protein of unknown function [Nocardia amikacinitolerans]